MFPGRLTPLVAALALSCASVKLYESDQGLIRTISAPNADVCPYQDVPVSVTTEPGFDGSVYVQGFAGSPHMVRFDEYGATQVDVVAVSSTDAERQVVEFDRKQCDTEHLSAWFRPSPYDPYVVEFFVDGGAEGAALTWSFGDGESATVSVPYVAHDYAAAMDHTHPYTVFQAVVTDPATDLAAWKTVAVRSHYRLSRDLGRARARLDCGVSIVPGTAPQDVGGNEGGGEVEGGVVGLPGTITLPDIELGTASIAVPDDAEWAIALHNPNAEALVFDQFWRSYRSCAVDGDTRWAGVSAWSVFGQGAADQLAPFGYPYDPFTHTNPLTGDSVSPPETAGQVEVLPGQTVTGAVVESAAGLGADTCVVGLHLVGEVEGTGDPAYASCYVQVAEGPSQAVESEMRAFLGDLWDSGAVPPDDEVTRRQLERLRAEGAVRHTAVGWEVTP